MSALRGTNVELSIRCGVPAMWYVALLQFMSCSADKVPEPESGFRSHRSFVSSMRPQVVRGVGS